MYQYVSVKFCSIIPTFFSWSVILEDMSSTGLDRSPTKLSWTRGQGWGVGIIFTEA